jgi:hypothetical protein
MPGLVKPIPDTLFVIDTTVYTVIAYIYAAVGFMGIGDAEKAMAFFDKVKRYLQTTILSKTGRRISWISSRTIFTTRTFQISLI